MHVTGPTCIDANGSTPTLAAGDFCRCPLGYKSLTLTPPGNSWNGKRPWGSQISSWFSVRVNLRFSCVFWVCVSRWEFEFSFLIHGHCVCGVCVKCRFLLGVALGPCEICPRGTIQPTEGSPKCLACPVSPLMTESRYTENPTWPWQVETPHSRFSAPKFELLGDM